MDLSDLSRARDIPRKSNVQTWNIWGQVELAWRSDSVMDCHATARGSIPGGNGVLTELHVLRRVYFLSQTSGVMLLYTVPGCSSCSLLRPMCCHTGIPCHTQACHTQRTYQLTYGSPSRHSIHTHDAYTGLTYRYATH